jgi:hypothetical protein
VSIHRRLKLITDPAIIATRGVMVMDEEFAKTPGALFIKGDQHRGSTLHCGQCERVLIADVQMPLVPRLANAALRCPECGSVNDLENVT